MDARLKYFGMLFIIMFLGYMFVYPYLTQALGGIAGGYTSGAATAVLGVISVFLLNKFGKAKSSD